MALFRVIVNFLQLNSLQSSDIYLQLSHKMQKLLMKGVRLPDH